MNALDNPGVEIALALSTARSLRPLAALDQLSLGACLDSLDCPAPSQAQALIASLSSQPIKRIQLGNEFCERLLPTPAELGTALIEMQRRGLALTLVTPMLSDTGLNRLSQLLPQLPAGSEVVVNDWGTLQQLSDAHPALVPVLGRLLNKMIKDPRLPSAQWTRLHPHNGQSPHFHALLQRLGIAQLEMDVPPFATAEQFHTAPMALAVHLPYGYAVKGRMCRIGSLQQPDGLSFVAGHACHKECLHYWAEVRREGNLSAHELSGFQRGNTQFYRHSAAMSAALGEALAAGRVQRLIVAGDWHENRRAA